MSGRFLGNAIAAREGAYFLQRSKSAVGNLIAQKRIYPSDPNSSTPPPTADVLPEVLRHSLPLSPPPHSPPSPSSFSKWALSSTPSSTSRALQATLNPIAGYISFPQVTLGPKRWELPESRDSVVASTANELRSDRYSHVSTGNMKAAAEGLAQVGKAFVIATVLVFGGATCAFIVATSKLHIHTSDDIRVRTRDALKPKVEMFKEQIVPLQDWVENMSRKWHIEGGEDIKGSQMVKELSKKLGGKSSN